MTIDWDKYSELIAGEFGLLHMEKIMHGFVLIETESYRRGDDQN